MVNTNTMGIDQYGRTYHNLGRWPRRELLNRLGRKRASKMYVDRDGSVVHAGYVIAGLWVTLYSVHDWKGTNGKSDK